MLLFDADGNDGAGEPDDRGWETQSSDNESSQACSIVTRESESEREYEAFSSVAFHERGFVIVVVVWCCCEVSYALGVFWWAIVAQPARILEGNFRILAGDIVWVFLDACWSTHTSDNYYIDLYGVGGVEIQGLGSCPSNDDIAMRGAVEPHKTANMKHS